MLFIRGLQPGIPRFRQCLKQNGGAFAQLAINLKDRATVSGEHHSTCARSEFPLPDDDLKKFIKRIANEFEQYKTISEDVSSEQGYSEVSRLLQSRTTVVESMKTLEELVQQDTEMKKLGEEEFSMYQEELDNLDEDLLEAILRNVGREDCSDIILEITTGVGGQEAMLFARDLFGMYLGYLEYLGFDHEVIQEDASLGAGGIRHASIAITGEKALEMFRHEGGVHRVQRIPATEKSGRIHTSTVSVAVLPQPTDIEVKLESKDLKIETKRASGAGGQHVNTTDSAVRITHLPTGISVESQTDRSQIKNKKTAMLRLRTKIYQMQLTDQQTTSGQLRKKQIGLGLRNEKIRTYNFNQDRITDHRITNGTVHNLKGFLEGGKVLQELQSKLQRQLQVKLLQEVIEKSEK